MIHRDMNWNQTGMPSALVSRLGQRREIGEFKAVLNDARNQIMRPVDAESMAQELAESGGREVIEMVKELTTALANAKRELEESNRRYEQLVSSLERRGVSLSEDPLPQSAADASSAAPSAGQPSGEPKSFEDGLAEWEEWDRRFRSLLG